MINLDNLFTIETTNEKYNVKIPKIIYQSWKTHNIPDHWKISPQSIQKIMPDWKYVLFNDEENRNLVKKCFPDFLPYYDAFPHNIMRADAARYCFLYVYGGLYMDLDFEVLQRLDSLFTSDIDIYLVKSGNIGSYYTNSFMASKPKCKFWLEVIEQMKKELPWYYIGKHIVVMNQSGPIMLSHVAKSTDIVIGNLPSRRIMPCSVCNIKCSTEGSYLKPLDGSSWIGYDTMFYNFFLCNWKTLIVLLIYLLLILFTLYILYKLNFIGKNYSSPTEIYNLFKSSIVK
jgi:mannosyltransferase OCH1-like enzyme